MTHAIVLSAIVTIVLACGPTPATLRVQRFSESGIYRVEPFDRTIHDAATVRALYKAALALPQIPPGDRFCPISFGLRYRLTFMATPRNVTVIVLEADGCREARFGLFDRRSTTDSFWALLADGLGLYTRGNDLFPLPREFRR